MEFTLLVAAGWNSRILLAVYNTAVSLSYSCIVDDSRTSPACGDTHAHTHRDLA